MDNINCLVFCNIQIKIIIFFYLGDETAREINTLN